MRSTAGPRCSSPASRSAYSSICAICTSWCASGAATADRRQTTADRSHELPVPPPSVLVVRHLSSGSLRRDADQQDAQVLGRFVVRHLGGDASGGGLHVAPAH